MLDEIKQTELDDSGGNHSEVQNVPQKNKPCLNIPSQILGSFQTVLKYNPQIIEDSDSGSDTVGSGKMGLRLNKQLCSYGVRRGRSAVGRVPDLHIF